jgi:hypothetical protein
MMVNQKNMPVYESVSYTNYYFISNENWGQYVSSKERRYLFLKAKDNGWKSEDEYYSYLDSMDPHAWVYHLCYQVDISKFNPRRDQHQTHATANQVIKTLPKDSPIQYFWYSLLSPASTNSKGMETQWIFQIQPNTIDEVKKFTIAIEEEFLEKNNGEVFDDVPVQDKKKIDNDDNDDDGHDPSKLLKRLNDCKWNTEDKLEGDPSLEGEIYFYLEEKKKLEVAKFMYYHDDGFQYADLYQYKFLPTQEKIKDYQRGKCNQSSFITETKAIFGEILRAKRAPRTQGRILRNCMGSLFEMRNNLKNMYYV